jgi:23S rRNA pseudouridine1911/1915/1917 synthase
MEFVVDQPARLDKYLASKVSVSRGRVQRAIKDGEVLVNGKKVLEPDFSVSVGDKLELPEFVNEAMKPSDIKLKIVYENDYMAVVDKPAGLIVHPGAGQKDETLSNALLSYFPGVESVGEPHRPGIVHRLDEDTSGLLLVAKKPEAYEYLKKLFLSREIEKEYLTLVHGVVDKLHGVIDTPIGKTSTHTKMAAKGGSALGQKDTVWKAAVTEYSVLKTSLPDAIDQFTLLRVKLHTGRTHQIRVHLSSIDHPVVGDQLYGGKFKQSDQQLTHRQFLHAYKLKFKLMDGTWLELSSKLPIELKQVLSKIGISYDDASI